MEQKRQCARCKHQKKEEDFTDGMKVCKSCRAIKQKSDDKKKKGTFDFDNMFVGTYRTYA